MTTNEILSIGDALFNLRGLTGRTWSEVDFIRELIRLRLPVYAVAPSTATVIHRERVNGKQVTTPRPDLRSSYVTLLQDEIEQLAHGGQTISDRPAWVFGDLPYRSWSDIQNRRAANHRVVSNWEVDHGEWMGESDVFFFADSIGITPNTTIVVPRHTIAQLVAAEEQRKATKSQEDGSEEAAEGSISLSDAHAEAAREPGLATLTDSVNAMDAVDGVVDDSDTKRDNSDRVRGITKDQVLTAFGHLVTINLSKALENGQGLFGDDQARVRRGTKGGRHKALWDPVRLAVGMHGNYRVRRAHLTRAFTDHQFLASWWEEWKEQAEELSDWH